jgi:branched-chain amino acid transport system ATP-binding protein
LKTSSVNTAGRKYKRHMLKKLVDTNIFIDRFTNPERYQDVFLADGLVFLSSVVLMELKAGVHTKAAKDAVHDVLNLFARLGRVVVPSLKVVLFNGNRLNGNSPARNIGKGIVYVPQGNTVFNDLTVLENLQMGAYLLTDKTLIEQRMREVFDLFPELAERKNLDAGNLSGGEKQMLALGRALMLKPEVLLLDDPSLGLSRKAVTRAFDTIKGIAKRYNTAVLIVEQNVHEVLRISDRVYVMVLGKVAAHDAPANLTRERIKGLFLGR